MWSKLSYIPLICSSLCLSTISVFYPLLSLARPQDLIVSPNGRYKAELISIPPKGLHYQIIDTNTNRISFATREERGRTQNDVKAGRFSRDSTQFAAAYHYGHKGKYTWIGNWIVETGVLRNSQKLPGFVRNIPDSAFVNFNGVWWTLECGCSNGSIYRTFSIKSCLAYNTGFEWSCKIFANQLGSRVGCGLIRYSRHSDQSPCDTQQLSIILSSNDFQSSPFQETISVGSRDGFELLFPSSITDALEAPVTQFSEIDGCSKSLLAKSLLFEDISLIEFKQSSVSNKAQASFISHKENSYFRLHDILHQYK